MCKRKNLKGYIIDEIIKMYIDGEKIKEICDIFDINDNTIYYYLNRFNIKLLRLKMR